jgi:glycyl-tRNA synthetase beta chain
MPEFFLELFSEEIPAGMQKHASQELLRICRTALGILSFNDPTLFYGPKRVAIAANVQSVTKGGTLEVRGPRRNAPEMALSGFLSKHKGITRKDLIPEGDYYWLRQAVPSERAQQVISVVLREVLKTFSWPKSMRWGQGGDFYWVRPLRRVVCLLDGEVIPIKLGPITASNQTEGHRTLAPGAFSVSSCADWQEKLRAHYVIADQEERREKILRGITEQAAIHGLTIVKDDALIDEVTGLVEWPVPLLGKIDKHFMDLPPEVRELSMKVNQRYFALRDATGDPAPYFAFIANLEAPDNGAAIIAGNERVLRARLSDARHFWDSDLKTPLSELLPKLEKITFHAKLDSQYQRVKRLRDLAREIAELLGADNNEADAAAEAGLLCKADLVTGMVGEFPELQGVIGGYYAAADKTLKNGNVVGFAIREHYSPKGQSDAVPTGIIEISLALADKVDMIIGFFGAGEEVTGSRDPYALRRAALGIIRIIRENKLRLELIPMFRSSRALYGDQGIQLTSGVELKALAFVAERLRIQLRDLKSRHDLLAAVFAAGSDDDLNFLVHRAEVLEDFLLNNTGADLLKAYKRTANILPQDETFASPDPNKFIAQEERDLFQNIKGIRQNLPFWLGENRQIDLVMDAFAKLRPPVDAFFERVTVNDPNPELRRNRLALLAQLRDTMHQIADFSKIEG